MTLTDSIQETIAIQKMTLDLRGETLLHFVAFLYPSNPEQILAWYVM